MLNQTMERGAVSLVDELKRPSTRDGSVSARDRSLMPPPSHGSTNSSVSSPAELSLTASPANGSPQHPLYTYSGTPLHSFYVNNWYVTPISYSPIYATSICIV
jgi:hypothetical protein